MSERSSVRLEQLLGDNYYIDKWSVDDPSPAVGDTVYVTLVVYDVFNEPVGGQTRTVTCTGGSFVSVNGQSITATDSVDVITEYGSGDVVLELSVDVADVITVSSGRAECVVCSLSDSITNLTATETITINPTNVSNATTMNFTLLGDKFVKLNWIDDSVTCSSSNIGTAILLGTLPTEYRPATQQWFTQKYGLNNSRGSQTSLRIMMNGQVHLMCWWTGSNQNTPCVFTDIYPLF